MTMHMGTLEATESQSGCIQIRGWRSKGREGKGTLIHKLVKAIWGDLCRVSGDSPRLPARPYRVQDLRPDFSGQGGAGREKGGAHSSTKFGQGRLRGGSGGV